MKSYVVIGLGRFGASLAQQLCKLGAEVLALDVRGDLVQQIAQNVTHAVVGDAQDKDVLKALGVRNLDCAIIAIGDNLAASVLITMNLKELGVPFVVCKAHDDTHRRVRAADGLVVEADLARARAVEAADEAQQGGLAAAALPYDAQDLSGLQGEGDAVHRPQGAVASGQVMDLQKRHRAAPPSPFRRGMARSRVWV